MWTSPVPYVLGALLNVALGALGTTQVVGRGQAVFQPIVPIAGSLVLSEHTVHRHVANILQKLTQSSRAAAATQAARASIRRRSLT